MGHRRSTTATVTAPTQGRSLAWLILSQSVTVTDWLVSSHRHGNTVNAASPTAGGHRRGSA